MNLRPSGYEPDELPNCSTPRYILLLELFYNTITSCVCQGISELFLKKYMRTVLYYSKHPIIFCFYFTAYSPACIYDAQSSSTVLNPHSCKIAVCCFNVIGKTC